MAKRKRKAGRRPRLRMTETEAKEYVKQHRLVCPKCGGHACQVALSAGWFKECYDCKHCWDYTDPRGGRITKEEYFVRAEKLSRRMWNAGTAPRSMERVVRVSSRKVVRVMAKKKGEKKSKKSKKAVGDLAEMSKSELVDLALEKDLPHAKIFNRTELIAGLTNPKKWDKIAAKGPLARIANQAARQGQAKPAKKSKKAKKGKKSKKAVKVSKK